MYEWYDDINNNSCHDDFDHENIGWFLYYYDEDVLEALEEDFAFYDHLVYERYFDEKKKERNAPKYVNRQNKFNYKGIKRDYTSFFFLFEILSFYKTTYFFITFCFILIFSWFIGFYMISIYELSELIGRMTGMDAEIGGRFVDYQGILDHQYDKKRPIYPLAPNVNPIKFFFQYHGDNFTYEYYYKHHKTYERVVK